MRPFILPLTCLALLLSGCGKDFLEVAPVSERTVANFYRTAADYNNAVVGTYATFKHPGLYGNGNGSLIWLGEVVSDNTDIGATRQPVNVASFEIEDLNFSLSNAYFNAAWTGHYSGISRANAILDRIDAATFDEALKNQYEGEARFLRAMFYFNLVRLFGDVQLITKEINDPFATSQLARSPAAEVYQFIVDDLTAAEAKLPATITAANAGRASSWAAKALLGKVYLTQKQYSQAAAKLKEVVDANVYNLLPSYANVFSPTTSFTANREMILAVQYKSGQIGQGGAFWSSWTPFNVNVPEFGITGGVGGGINRPTADLIAAYEPDDQRKAASLATSFKDAQGREVREAYPVKFRQTGMLAADSDVDFPILRYADVLLMYGEALNELGQTAEAHLYLNMVRKRAGLADKTNLGQAELRLAFEQERRVELAFESHRWFDLVRTDRYLPVLSAKGYNVKEYHRFFPIPQEETDLNQNLGQNEGYN